MWEWWDNTIAAAGDALKHAWGTVNEWLDTYIWDTSKDEAVVESWVRDTFDIADQEGKGLIGEVWDEVNDWVDFYIWDTDEDVAILEKFIKGIPDDIIPPVVDNLNATSNAIQGSLSKVKEKIEDIIFNITLALGVGWEAMVEALTSLPDTLKNMNSIDLDKFVEDGMKLYEVQRQLALRIQEEMEKRSR